MVRCDIKYSLQHTLNEKVSWRWIFMIRTGEHRKWCMMFRYSLAPLISTIRSRSSSCWIEWGCLKNSCISKSSKGNHWSRHCALSTCHATLINNIQNCKEKWRSIKVNYNQNIAWQTWWHHIKTVSTSSLPGLSVLYGLHWVTFVPRCHDTSFMDSCDH